MKADPKTYAEWNVQYTAIANAWPLGAMNIIREKNPEMHMRMGRITEQLDVMMAKPSLDKTERKQFTELLAAWRRIHELGIVFAGRYLNQ